MKVEGRTFIVSGGSAGLGLATVHKLLEARAYVLVLDLREAQADKSLDCPQRIKYIKTDITNPDSVDSAVKSTIAWTTETGAHLRGAINCAGVGIAAKIVGSDGVPHSLDLWDFTIKVNLTGAFDLTRHVVKHLIGLEPEGDDDERGVIIFVASSAAFEGQVGQAAYAASKGGLVSVTLPLSRDLARHGIRVNTIAPAAFSSAMTDRMSEKTRNSLTRELGFPKRFGTGTEFAQAALFLVECGYMNGETIRLSGGARLPGRL